MVKTLELNPRKIDELALSFAHEVGIIPTKDTRVTEVFEHLRSIHPTLFCLFDGDAAGNNYTAACCRLAHPPKTIVRWPAGWAMEHVIGWIAEADSSVLSDAELVAARVPQTPNEFVAALSSDLKSDEIVHARIADAMTANDSCRRRIAHILRLLADLATGRAPVLDAAASETDANGITTVWTFNHGIRGI